VNSHEIFTGNNQLDIVHVSKIRDRSFCRNLRDATLSRSGLAELKITSASELIRCSVRSPRLYSNSFRRFTQYTAASQIINNMKFDCFGGVLLRPCQKTKLNLIPGGASALPGHLKKSAWRPPKCPGTWYQVRDQILTKYDQILSE
jgi:hypothetical protein